MHQRLSHKLNISVILFFAAAMIAVCSSGAYAASVPKATGQINSDVGAILRGSSTTDSSVLTVLPDNTKVTIHKEVYKKVSSTSKTDRWYYVTAKGQNGYVRADLIDNVKYGSVKGRIIQGGVNYRKGPGTSMPIAGVFSKGTNVTVVLKANPVYSTRGTSFTWYKIKYNQKYYYVCSSKIELIEEKPASSSSSTSSSQSGSSSSKTSSSAKNITDKQFESYLKKQGFPESYKKKLRVLHKAHPNWVFVAYKTNIKWSTALSKQTSGGTSLVSGSFPSSYRDGSRQYEKGWYKANKTVVAYYMDPRNFLNEKRIYMFEDLSYKPAYQKNSVVNAILSPTKLPKYGFSASIFVSAGKASKVSPVFLASRARLETGNGGDAVNGTKILGKKVYNPFNIGAFGGTNPLYNGLLYAYGKGWTTPSKAVSGGAKELAKNYINKGQYTGYYQRFNVRNGAGKVGTHQYMTNIMAPYSEALSTKNSYAKYGITNKSLVFEIPIYTSMPKSTKLP